VILATLGTTERTDRLVLCFLHDELLLVASAVRLARGDGLLSARAASPLSPLRLAEVGAYGTLLLQAAFVARWAALGCVGVDVTKPF
jgi:hypothetical protein